MAHLLTTRPEIFIPGITKGVQLYDLSPTLAVWSDSITARMSCNDRGEIKLISHGDLQLPSPFGGTVGPMSEVDYDIVYPRSYKPVRIGAKHSVDQLAMQIEHIGDGGKASIIKALSSKFGLSYTNYKNMAAADLFNGGFSTSTTSDGVAGFSNSHLLASGTFSNRGDGSVDLGLSYSALEVARGRMMETLSHRGNPSPIAGPYRLHVPVALEALANRLTGATLMPGSNNNDPNYVGKKMKVVCNPWYTSDTAWGLQAVNSEYHNMFYVEQRAFKITMAPDPDYDTMRYYTSASFGFGWHDWRGFWGTTG